MSGPITDTPADVLLDAEPMARSGNDYFGYKMIGLQVVFMICFCQVDYNLDAEYGVLYMYYFGIACMMFIGFGYLMTFLKVHGLSAVGLTMLVTCLGAEWAMLFEQSLDQGLFAWKLDILSIINAMFAVAAVLISFGGLIGKVTPSQLTIVTILEITFYVVNKLYVLGGGHPSGMVAIADVGGTIIIHVFGAYFGLACCATLGKSQKNTDWNGSSYVSDRFSLIGTTFLWLFWPSFVAAVAPAGVEQNRAIVNTVLSLLASTVVTFGMTPLLSGKKLSAVPIQNATLAGGVAIGVTANLAIRPIGAFIIGGGAGLISTLGFCFQDMIIPNHWDTCGINNLHGMPGIFGALVSVVVPLIVSGTGVTWWHQLAGLVGTLVVASLSGAMTGFIIKAMGSSNMHFHDTEFWTDCEDVHTTHEA